jgi:hypothetical protein
MRFPHPAATIAPVISVQPFIITRSAETVIYAEAEQGTMEPIASHLESA